MLPWLRPPLVSRDAGAELGRHRVGLPPVLGSLGLVLAEDGGQLPMVESSGIPLTVFFGFCRLCSVPLWIWLGPIGKPLLYMIVVSQLFSKVAVTPQPVELPLAPGG